MATPRYSRAGARTESVAGSERTLIVTDRGGSIWRRTASRPDHPWRFRSADRFLPGGGTDPVRGGWWELAPDVQTITPAMFGCGPHVADNAPGLSDFYAYVETFGCTADHSGRYPVRSGIVMGAAADVSDEGEAGRSTVLGRLTLEVTAPIPGAVLANRMKRATRIEAIAVEGGGSIAYADKLFDIGLLFEGSARGQAIEDVEIADARLFGVLDRGGGRGGGIVGTAHIHDCGSGRGDSEAGPAPAGAFLEADHGGLARGGRAGSYYQTTTFQLKPGSALPPPAIEAFGMVCFVRSGGEEFPVASFDRTANRVTVWGWAPVETPAAAGRIGFVFGGGWGSAGGGARVRCGRLTVTASAIGHQKGALDPATTAATLEHNYVGQTIGSSPAGASGGGVTLGRFEGNKVDIWYLAGPQSPDAGYRVVADRAPSLPTVRRHCGRRSDGSKVDPHCPGGVTVSCGGDDRLALLPSGPAAAAGKFPTRSAPRRGRGARRKRPPAPQRFVWLRIYSSSVAGEPGPEELAGAGSGSAGAGGR